MGIQKAIEYINKVITLFEENPVDDLNDELIKGHLYNAIHELTKNIEDDWEGNIKKCGCGKNSVCKLRSENIGKEIYFCWDCFFKYRDENIYMIKN